MRLRTKHFHAGRLAAGVGLMLAGAMLTGCMSADRRSNTTNQPKTTKATTNSNQSSTGNSNSTGSNANVAANSNGTGTNATPNSAGPNANTNANTIPSANGAPGISPLGRPTGLNNTPYNSIPGSNMNNPPQFGSGLQQTGAMAPANSNALQPIATSVNTPNRGNPAIQPLTGPGAGPGGMPALDAVPSANGNNNIITSQRPVPPAVSMQGSDKTLNFPQSGPLLPTPSVNPGPVRTVPANATPVNPATLGPVNSAPLGSMNPAPISTSNLTPLGNGPLNLAPAGNGPINPAPVNTIPNGGIAPLPPAGN
jgi:hypothetical protein